MKINGPGYGPRGLRPAREVQPVPGEAPDASTPRPATRGERSDRIEISDAGRARSGQLHPVDAGAADRLAAIRQRVLHGAYDADVVVEALATRILDRGDV